jgi:hypothetical protein
MTKQYGFKANERMYKKRITDWNSRRNLAWSENEEISKVISQKILLHDHNATIIVNGQDKKVTLFARHMKQARRRFQATRSPHQPLGNVHEDDASLSGLKSSQKQLRCIFAFKSSLRETMYPPGDSRFVEMICRQVSHKPGLICNDTEDIRSDVDLHSFLNLAMEGATATRYQEARAFLNRALDCFQLQATSQRFLMPLKLIDCLRLRSGYRPDHFNAFGLFHEHVLELCAEVYGPRHPSSTTFALFFKLEAWDEAIQCAFRCGLMSIKPTSATPALFGVKSWLSRGLAFCIPKLRRHLQGGTSLAG